MNDRWPTACSMMMPTWWWWCLQHDEWANISKLWQYELNSHNFYILCILKLFPDPCVSCIVQYCVAVGWERQSQGSSNRWIERLLTSRLNFYFDRLNYNATVAAKEMASLLCESSSHQPSFAEHSWRQKHMKVSPKHDAELTDSLVPVQLSDPMQHQQQKPGEVVSK